jgi:hypothetical protein
MEKEVTQAIRAIFHNDLPAFQHNLETIRSSYELTKLWKLVVNLERYEIFQYLMREYSSPIDVTMLGDILESVPCTIERTVSRFFLPSGDPDLGRKEHISPTGWKMTRDIFSWNSPFRDGRLGKLFTTGYSGSISRLSNNRLLVQYLLTIGTDLSRVYKYYHDHEILMFQLTIGYHSTQATYEDLESQEVSSMFMMNGYLPDRDRCYIQRFELEGNYQLADEILELILLYGFPSTELLRFMPTNEYPNNYPRGHPSNNTRKCRLKSFVKEYLRVNPSLPRPGRVFLLRNIAFNDDVEMLKLYLSIVTSDVFEDLDWILGHVCPKVLDFLNRRAQKMN